MSLSNTEKLKVEIVGHVARVTIDNPAANTWKLVDTVLHCLTAKHQETVI